MTERLLERCQAASIREGQQGHRKANVYASPASTREAAMTLLPTGPDISARAIAIVCGLLRTNRAIGAINREFGMLRLKCRSGGYYWISLNGDRVQRGDTLSSADKLQPKFIDLMERRGQ